MHDASFPATPEPVPCEGIGHVLRRKEEKYEVGPARAVMLREEIARHLPSYEFQAGETFTHITTLYFDTRERDFFRRAEKHYNDNVKIRVKEYYYGGPLNGGEDSDATPAGRYHSARLCYVEIKRTVQGLVEKLRLPLPKESLGALLAGRDVWAAIEGVAPPATLGVLTAAYRQLDKYLKAFALELTSIVTYRRLVFQDREEVLRVTFDDHLRVYPPLPALYDKYQALTPVELGRPVRQTDKVILEVKYPDTLPQWLAKLLGYQSARRLSKFTSSVRMLLRDGAAEGSPHPAAPRRGLAAAAGEEDTQLLPEGLS